MSQYSITKNHLPALQESAAFVECFKYGHRAVIFLEKMDDAVLDDLVHPETKERLTAYGGKPLEGKGMVFENPEDKCLQAIEINGNTCIVIALNGDKATAEAEYTKITTDIKAALPCGIHTARDVEQVFKIAKDIVPDVYNSDITWYRSNTIDLIHEGDFHFVEGRGVKTGALYFPGKVSIDTGATATPQEYLDGGFLIKESDGTLHGCSVDAFNAAYRYKADGILHAIDDNFVTAATPSQDMLEVFLIGEAGE